MRQNRNRNELAEKAVTVLATAFVLVGGAAASSFLIATNSATPINTLLIFAGSCIGVGLVLWLLREPDPLSPRAKRFAWFRRSKPKTVHYQLRVRKPGAQTVESPPQPPTAESVRELAQEGLHTWVPSPAKPRSRPPESVNRRWGAGDSPNGRRGLSLRQ